MGVEEHLEVVELARVDRALGQHYDVDATRLFAGGHEHAIQ